MYRQLKEQQVQDHLFSDREHIIEIVIERCNRIVQAVERAAG